MAFSMVPALFFNSAASHVHSWVEHRVSRDNMVLGMQGISLQECIQRLNGDMPFGINATLM